MVHCHVFRPDTSSLFWFTTVDECPFSDSLLSYDATFCKSLAYKHQLKFCYLIFKSDFLSECDLVVGTGSMVTVDPVSGDESDVCPATSGVQGHIFSANWITLNGITYRPWQTLLIGIVNDMPLFEKWFIAYSWIIHETLKH